MSTSSSTVWAALAAASKARGAAHLQALTTRQPSSSTQGPRTLEQQRNMDWRDDVHAFKFEVFEPTAWDSKGHHLTGTRAR